MSCLYCRLGNLRMRLGFAPTGMRVGSCNGPWVQAADGISGVQKQRARKQPRPSPSGVGAKEAYPAPPFYNTSPTAVPPTGPLFPQQPPPEMATCRG